MKYRFIVEFDAPEGILESQVGVPIMNALNIDRIKVEAAQHSAHPTRSGCGDSARSRVRKNKNVLPAKSG